MGARVQQGRATPASWGPDISIVEDRADKNGRADTELHREPSITVVEAETGPP